MEKFPTHFMRQYYPNSKIRTKQKRKKEEVQELGKVKKERKRGSGRKRKEENEEGKGEKDKSGREEGRKEGKRKE